MTTRALVADLREAGQDHEFYPTTNEIIAAMLKDMGSIQYMERDSKIRGRHRHNGNFRSYESILDVGAGNGKVLSALKEQKLTGYYGRDHSFSRFYAIEKSPMLVEQLPSEVFVVGTDFFEQSLLAKEVDVIFSNPPYSIFEEWTTKLIRESAAPLVYLVIPRRWKESEQIAGAIEFRQAEAHVVGSFDFEDSEDRQARAKVDLIRIELSLDKDDAFECFFASEFADLKERFNADKEKEAAVEHETARRSQESREQQFSQLVVGETYPAAMVELYNAEMGNIRRNYDLASKLDADLMRELEISPVKIMGCLKERLKGLRGAYWQELFSRIAAITDRVTSSRRQTLLKTLRDHCHVDFTIGNIHAIILWVIKNANDHLDEQLIEVFEKMVSKANVQLYQSNKRPFEWDRWRYNNGDRASQSTHFALEYRMVLHHCGGIQNGGYSWNSGLTDHGAEFLGDLLTVARNLGFICETAHPHLIASRSKWVRQELRTFHYRTPENTEDILFEVRAYENGNMHVRLNQKFALALNVEYGRLKGWLRSGEEAFKEMRKSFDEAGQTVDDATKYFRSNLALTFTSNTSLLLPAPSSNQPAHSNSSHEPPLEDMQRFNPLTGTITTTTPVVATTPATKRRKAKAQPARETVDTDESVTVTNSVTVTHATPPAPPAASATVYLTTLARSAAAVPLAAYVCKLGSDCTPDVAATIRDEFAQWCDQQPAGAYANWRDAWSAYDPATPEPSVAPAPSNVVQFTVVDPTAENESESPVDITSLPVSHIVEVEPIRTTPDRRAALLAALA